MIWLALFEIVWIFGPRLLLLQCLLLCSIVYIVCIRSFDSLDAVFQFPAFLPRAAACHAVPLARVASFKTTRLRLYQRLSERKQELKWF